MYKILLDVPSRRTKCSVHPHIITGDIFGVERALRFTKLRIISRAFERAGVVSSVSEAPSMWRRAGRRRWSAAGGSDFAAAAALPRRQAPRLALPPMRRPCRGGQKRARRAERATPKAAPPPQAAGTASHDAAYRLREGDVSAERSKGSGGQGAVVRIDAVAGGRGTNARRERERGASDNTSQCFHVNIERVQ